MVIHLGVAAAAAGLYSLWLHHQYCVPLRDGFASAAVLFGLYIAVASQLR